MILRFEIRHGPYDVVPASAVTARQTAALELVDLLWGRSQASVENTILGDGSRGLPPLEVIIHVSQQSAGSQQQLKAYWQGVVSGWLQAVNATDRGRQIGINRCQVHVELHNRV